MVACSLTTLGCEGVEAKIIGGPPRPLLIRGCAFAANERVICTLSLRRQSFLIRSAAVHGRAHIPAQRVITVRLVGPVSRL